MATATLYAVKELYPKANKCKVKLYTYTRIVVNHFGLMFDIKIFPIGV